MDAIPPVQSHNTSFLTSEWKTRVLSAIWFAPLTLSVVWAGGYIFYGAIVFLLGGLVYEWLQIFHVSQKKRSFVFVFGLIYIISSILSLVYLESSYSSKFIYFILCYIWIIDTSAYCVGKKIGGPKLVPHISPNKTWAGFIGGIIIPFFMALPLVRWFGVDLYFLKPVPLYILIIGLIAHGGDLLESWAKRYLGVKDSGFLIPGHGGLLDRFDSLLSVSLFLGAITLFMLFF